MQLSLDLSNNETERPAGPLRPFFVKRIHAAATLRRIIEAYHYSHNLPTGKHISYGAFLDPDCRDLYAVAVYGVGANMDGGAFLAKLTGLPVARENYVTLQRLCRIGPKEEKAQIAMTKFLKLCHADLKQNEGVRFVVSYADPWENGTVEPKPRTTPWQAGGIYAAANFRYLGKTVPERHFKDRDGNFVHRRVPYRWKNRRNKTMADAYKALHLTPCMMGAKERWFLDLGRKPPPGKDRR